MGTCNRYVKFGRKIPNHLEKIPGGFFTHTVHSMTNADGFKPVYYEAETKLI